IGPIIHLLPRFDKFNPTKYLVPARLLSWTLVAHAAALMVCFKALLLLLIALLIFSYKEIAKIDQILIVGQFNKEDRKQIQYIISHSNYSIKVMDDISNYDELIKSLQQSKYYLNLTTNIQIPLLMLLAMSAGCIPIRLQNTFIDDILNDTNSKVVNTTEELVNVLSNKKLKDDIKPKLLNKIIVESFPLDDFISSWNNIFDSYYTSFYIRT
ncbi:hypothetical protein LCGC14_2506150, partial [marine sediment metagenome]